MFFPRSTLLAIVALLAIAGTNAMADATAAGESTSSTGNLLESLKKNGKSSYMMWLSGMNSQAMDGNINGDGTNLSVQHYFSNGYKLPHNFSISASLLFQQVIDDVANEKEDKFYLTDPYLTFSQSKLYDNESKGINVSGYIRYYVPSSVQTRNGINDFSSKEQGRGRIRIGITPSKTFLDGALTTSLNLIGVYRIAKYNTNERFLNQQQKDDNGSYLRDETTGGILRNSATGYNGNREDFFLIFIPGIAYSLNSKLELSFDWSSGFIRHRTEANPAKKQSKWTNLAEKDPDYGQYMSFGVSYSPTKKFNINPYASWGPVYQGLKNTDFGLIATYSFL